MEHGNRKKKKVGLIITICVAIIGIATAITIYKLQDEEFSFDKSCKVLFRHLLSRTEPGEIEVLSLDGYYKDGYNYYYVETREYDYDIEDMGIFTMVYYGNFDDIDMSFNPNWTDKGDLIEEYYAYLDAKENGIHRSYTQDEIKSYIDEYYKE